MVSVDVLRGDMDEPLPFEDETFTAVLTDPPYGLGFMGKHWDHGVPGADVWREVWRVCKPGAVMLAFGGTRTWHRLAVAIEDAGWEIEDTLMWLYGSGFPKSHDISKAIDKEAGAEREVVGESPNWRPAKHHGGAGFDAAIGDGPAMMNITAPATPAAALWAGYGTALKPAWEPVILARAPRPGTYAECALAHGTGALWIDGGRIGTAEDMNPRDFDDTRRTAPKFSGTYRDNQYGDCRSRPGAIPNGRWPANLLLDPEAAEMLGKQSGVREGGAFPARQNSSGTGRSMRGTWQGEVSPPRQMADTGTAARFFYTAKSSRGERSVGLDGYLTVKYTIGQEVTALWKSESTELVASLEKVMCGLGIKSLNIVVSGDDITARCHRDSLSTTKTETSRITESRILSLLTPSPTSAFMGGVNSLKANGGSLVPCAESSSLSRQNTGISPSRDTCLITDVAHAIFELLSKISASDDWQEWRSTHPTHKPLDLCRYLATLIRPPEAYLDEARLLVPYSGSGSEMIGAVLAGWRNVTGIEREAEYAEIARARLAWWERAYRETGLTEPKEILAAMKRRQPAPLLETIAG